MKDFNLRENACIAQRFKNSPITSIQQAIKGKCDFCEDFDDCWQQNKDKKQKVDDKTTQINDLQGSEEKLIENLAAKTKDYEEIQRKFAKVEEQNVLNAKEMEKLREELENKNSENFNLKLKIKKFEEVYDI